MSILKLLTSTVCVALFIVGNKAVANNKTLDIAVGWDRPPYVIAKGNTGFELDLLTAIFNKLGYRYRALYLPDGRSRKMLKEGTVDAALVVNDKMFITPQQLSEVYVTYQNVALSLPSRQLSIPSVNQLKNHTIVSFQNASVVLGQEYREAIAKSPRYIEVPDKIRQTLLFLQGKVDVSVVDINIFNYLSQQVTGESQLNKVDIHRIFPATPYQMGFKDVGLRKAFDQALLDYRRTQSYTDLLKKYKLSGQVLPANKAQQLKAGDAR